MAETVLGLDPPIAPLPIVDEDTAPFWHGGADGHVLITRCRSCGLYLHPPAPVCARCLSFDVAPEPVSGKAHLASYTVNHQPWTPTMAVPFIIGVVELVEQPSVRLTTNIVDTAIDRLQVGLPVSVRFVNREEIWLPFFAEDAGLMVAPGEKLVAITGIGQSPIFRRPTERSGLSLTAESCLAAIADAGLDRRDIDGVATWPGKTDMDLGLGPVSVTEVKEALGLELNWFNGAPEAPGQYGAFFYAIGAIVSGMARHVLVFRSVKEASSRARTQNTSAQSGDRVPDARFQWQLPFGALSAANWCAMFAQRHFHEFGTTSEQLGQIAVNNRRNAGLNPKAVYRTPLSIEEYLDSRMITTPLHLYDCDVPVDMSTAMVLSGIDAARDLRHPPIRIEAVGSAVKGRYSWDQRADLTTMAAHDAAEMMWSRTDLKPKDVDTAQLYDGFSILTLLWLEALGFAPHGEGGRFIEGGRRISRDGELPLNTHGGQLSEGRSHGFGLVHEAVLQMRGAAGERQLVKRPEVALVAAGGGPLGGCMLLCRE